jgi:alkylation response protein AidB-like acyl-CoA dehydrogenase
MLLQKKQIIDGDHYLLNGTKIDYKWILGFYVHCHSQTDIEKGHKGINAFIVEKGWAGFDIGPKEKKMEYVVPYTLSLM